MSVFQNTAKVVLQIAALGAILAGDDSQVCAQTGCDFYKEVADYANDYIYTPNYPGYYPGNTNCRWYAVASSGSRIYLVCNDFSIPRTANCVQDRVSISPTGDTTLADAEYYCGEGTFTMLSTTSAMNIVLRTSYYSQGGRFLCNVTAFPSNVNPTTTTPAPSKCSCGWEKTTRIVNGETTGVNEFPMMAGLVDRTQRNVFCGGTIVAKRYVLTAAHCLVKKQTDNVVVLVGEHDIATGNDTSAARLYQVNQFIAHPDYNTLTHTNDFAIIQLAQDIFFSLEVGPACLPWNTQYTFENDYVEALGWGLLSFGGEAPTTLQKVALQVISNSQCYQAFNSSTITGSVMCTYTPGKDACQSDSGGPLLWQHPNNGKLYLAGIISVGISCATERPAINTRVTSFLSWLAKTTPDAEYCIVNI